MNEHAIVVEKLTKTFGTFKAVDDISFRVRTGEVFGFLGANGAGKSTTIRMLCGLLNPTSGKATVGGHDVATNPEQVKSSIGYMSQKFSLYGDLTVKQNIHFFGGVYGLRTSKLRERTEWVLDMAGLKGREDSLTGILAGGFKQRLALGCAILHEPKILFLDEPTGGVDPISRRKFWELINRLSDEGVTVIVTTHFLDEAEYCNEIILIEGGKLIAKGSPVELKTEHMRYPILEVETETTVEAFEAISKEDWAIEASIFGTRVHVMVKEEQEGKRKIADLLKSRNLSFGLVERIIPSLEDVFLFLLEKNQGLKEPGA